ncbi:MAG: DUF1194 domain-containing protein [Shimia sp.]|nr:DUF1194 domain-containing protein [Shimia sp.]
MIRAALFAALTLVLAAPAARATECRLALLLALDVSSSVDAHEDKLQRLGLAAALTSPSVQAAFFNAPKPVALAVYEWSGISRQNLLLNWTVIETPQSLHQSAARLGLCKRQTTEFPTALGHAVVFASTLFEKAPRCDMQVLDVSGDGANNDGVTPKRAYKLFPLDGVIVNGLAIETFGAKAAVLGAKPGDMAAYYRSELIKGPGAFVEVAKGFDDFERAMRRKLERELSMPVFGALHAPRK